MKNPGKEKQFRCIDFPPCEKSFNQIENLRAHLRLHSLNHNAVLKCPEVGCTSVLSSLKHLKRHIKEVHSKEPRFKCPFCDEKFLRKCWLRNHTESCHDFHELQCTHEACNCRRIFKTPSRLHEHLQPRIKKSIAEKSLEPLPETVKKPGRPIQKQLPPQDVVYRCLEEGCGREYTERKNLLAHKRAIHTKLNQFACPVPGCGKLFIYKHVMFRHTRNVHGVTVPAETEFSMRRKRQKLNESNISENDNVGVRDCTNEELKDAASDTAVVVVPGTTARQNLIIAETENFVQI